MKKVFALFFVALCLIPTLAVAQREQVLYTFGTNPNDGTYPYAGLVFDLNGNLYGTTTGGGTMGCGTVFMLTPSTGTWIESIIHNFCSTGSDGAGPSATADLIIDSDGNLYGTTQNGGMFDKGVAFELSPLGNGSWTESVLYPFTGGGDGGDPQSALLLDMEGNLYGETTSGGDVGCDAPSGCGTVFELTRLSDGSWSESVVWTFGGGQDGENPKGGLIFDSAGNLYGTTEAGGGSGCNQGCGTVFELMPVSGGGWAESILTTFESFFNAPMSRVSLDSAGNLYGTVFNNGVFRLSKQNGTWVKTEYIENGNIYGGVYIDEKHRTLYSTTFDGGNYHQGSVFSISQDSGNEYSFCRFKNCPSGSNLASGLIADKVGNLYGTAAGGGQFNVGVVFEMVP